MRYIVFTQIVCKVVNIYSHNVSIPSLTLFITTKYKYQFTRFIPFDFLVDLFTHTKTATEENSGCDTASNNDLLQIQFSLPIRNVPQWH